MKLTFCLETVAAAMLLVVSCANAADGKSDVEKLQGHWVAVSGEIDGKAMTKSELADFAISFSGKQLRRKPDVLLIVNNPNDPNEKPAQIDTSDSPYDFNVDPGKVPKELNVEIGWSGTQTVTCSGTLRRSGKPIFEKSIYSLEGDKLTVCWGTGTLLRPQRFATKPGDDLTLIIYERPKKRGK